MSCWCHRPNGDRRLRSGCDPRWLHGGSGRRAKSHLEGLNLDHRVLDVYRPIVDADVPDADVVVATWWETAEWVAKLSPSKGAKMYFVQGHEIFPGLPLERCRATYRLPLRKIVVAEWLRRTMATEYGDTDVDLVPNSVDHEQFHAVPRGKQARPTIGFLYSPVGIKGVDVALRAIELIHRRVPDLHVVSFGFTVLPPSLSTGIDFQHDPPQMALRDIYASCDVWLTASRSEGFNLPAMEAMACRTPVVSTRTGWPEESIVDGLNGYLVDVDDAAALAEAACRLLGLPDERWRAVSNAAFETVRDSSWARSADLFEHALSHAADAWSSQQIGAAGTPDRFRGRPNASETLTNERCSGS